MCYTWPVDSCEASVVLNMLPGMGPVRLRALLKQFSTPQQILSAGASDLRQVAGVGQEVAGAIADWESHVDLQGELALAEEMDVTILSWDSAEYPTRLRELHDPPIVLYCLGKLDARDQHAVSVVGTRKPSHYGQECTKKLSYQIAYAGLTVVSGLARGVDTLAHTAALAAKGRTLAVIGSGLAELYPAENATLARRIADGSGAILSEFPLKTKPDKQTFPMRNRIIAGLAEALLVVECGQNSGALITASQALDQGRSIFAVPGPIDRPTSAGCNRLIQQGAKLAASANDVLDELQTLLPELPQLTSAKPTERMTQNEQAVHDAIGSDETHIDEIARKCGLPMQTVSSTLLRLEMRRLVKQVPGSFFVKLI